MNKLLQTSVSILMIALTAIILVKAIYIPDEIRLKAIKLELEQGKINLDREKLVFEKVKYEDQEEFIEARENIADWMDTWTSEEKQNQSTLLNLAKIMQGIK